MKSIGPGLAARITDYSENPRGLLRELAAPLLRLKSSQQLPIVHVRRGWLRGSHLLVTARPYADRTADLDGFLAEAARLATALPAAAPPQARYRERAVELARWENVPVDLRPPYPQGGVAVWPNEPKPGAVPALTQATDQILGRFLEPVLASAATADDALLPHLARVMALLARSHPRGISAGALPFRSHAEGISSATGNHTDLRSRFAARFEQDEATFLDALRAPIGADAALLAWRSAFDYAWGVAEGLTAGHHIDDRVLQAAAGTMEMPLGTPVRSDFIGEVLASRLAADPSYRHLAHRVVLNVLYASLTCFGITPMQRYYLCYGLSEGADRLTGETSIQRLRRFAAELAPN
jgi:hypothetical protein